MIHQQEIKVLDHLQSVGSLSGLEAATLYRVVDLPKRISELRKAGFEITGEFRRDHTGSRYMRYTLAASSSKAA